MTLKSFHDMTSTHIEKKKYAHARRKNEIREILRCEHCASVSFMPKQCRNGHIFCHLCSEELSGRCIIAHCNHGPDPSKFGRALAIETMAQQYLWSCPRRSSGCTVECEYDKMRVHEKTCCFYPRPCFIDAGECRCVRYNQKDVVFHLAEKHGIVNSACPELFVESGLVVRLSMRLQDRVGMFGDHILATQDGVMFLVFTMFVPESERVGVVAVVLSDDGRGSEKTVRVRVTDAKQRTFVQQYPVFTLQEIIATSLLEMYKTSSMLLFGRQLLKSASDGTNFAKMHINIQ